MMDFHTYAASIATKGNSFKRARLYVKQKLRHEAARKYMDPATGTLDPDKVSERSRVNCGSYNPRHLFANPRLPHVPCADCSFICASPALKPAIFEEHYRDVSNAWTEIVQMGEVLTPEFIHRNRLGHHLICHATKS